MCYPTPPLPPFRPSENYDENKIVKIKISAGSLILPPPPPMYSKTRYEYELENTRKEDSCSLLSFLLGGLFFS